jgi:2-dehydropantoate 2-reductase
VDQWHQNVQAIRREGLKVQSSDGQFTTSPTVFYFDELGGLDEQFDFVFLAVKSYDTAWVARVLQPKIAPGGVVVSLQNGINEDQLAPIVGRSRTIGCVVQMTGAMFEPGIAVRYSSPNWSTFLVGELDGDDSQRLAQVVAILRSVGPTHTTGTIWGALWAKLALNCMTNGLAGLTGLTTPELWTNAAAVGVMLELGAEVAWVADATGQAMEHIRPSGAPNGIPAALLRQASRGDLDARANCVQLLAEAGAARKGRFESTPSLLQDVRKGRRTEIDYLNGYISRCGRNLGVKTPLNDELTALVHELESGTIQPGPFVIRRLLDVELRRGLTSQGS